MTCPIDGNTRQDGQSLCPDCIDRVYSELRWLGAIYPQLLPALTHRIHVEHVDRDKVVIVAGGGDPLKSGIDLHEDALQLRTQTRKLAYQGLGWLMERGYSRPAGASQEPGMVLREIARNLHWILSDDDPERIQDWAGALVATRLAAEDLITPATTISRIKTNQRCQLGDDCPGELILWGTDPRAVCQINPEHRVSRETLIIRITKQRLTR